MNSDATNIFDSIENKFAKVGEISMFFRAFVLDNMPYEIGLFQQQLPLDKYPMLITLFIEGFLGYDSDFEDIIIFRDLVYELKLTHPYEEDYFYENDTETIVEARRYIGKMLVGFVRDNQETAFRKKIENHIRRIYMTKGCLNQICSILKCNTIEQEKFKAYKDPDKYNELQSRALAYLQNFIASANSLDEQCDKWMKLLNEFQPLPEDEYQEDKSTMVEENEFQKSESMLKWIGSKSDLAELIWVLYKSELIVDERTGKPVVQKNLAEAIGDLLGTSIDVPGLLKARDSSTKANEDKKTFMATLNALNDERIYSKKK